MNLSIRYNLPESDWDAFAAANAADGGFLQSWNWGKFQENCGRKIFRLAIADGAKILGLALIVKQQMPLGFSYLYCPRGPIMSPGPDRRQTLDQLLAAVRKIAKSEQAIFCRFDPPWIDGKELLAAGFSPNGSVQPKSTLILDLLVSEDGLLAQMKPKTRYNIKLAQKHGIAIVESSKTEADFDLFWELIKKTSERDSIKPHAREYYRQMLLVPGIRLVFANLNGRPVAANVMARFGRWEIYLHGASDYEFRDKMGPYLLQWEMIRQAKASGVRYYDFWGADLMKWPGVTRFKQGFAPKRPLTEYIGAYDLPQNKLFFRLYNALRRSKN